VVEDPLPVAFDVTPLAGVRTGIGSAVAELFDALGDMRSVRLLPYAVGTRPPGEDPSLPPGTRRLRAPTRALLASWSASDRPRIDGLVRGAGVVHATAFIAPPTTFPSLVTVHDTTFVSPDPGVAPAVRRFGAILRRAVARGCWVHCTTRTVADEVRRRLPELPAEHVVVVPFGVPRLDAPGPMPPAVGASVDGVRYVLALGALERRKNVPALVRAFDAVADRDPDLLLVIAGPDGPDRPAVDEAIAAAHARDRVVLAGHVDRGARRALLERAAVLAYPSRYEGFGFPMLEAMTLGVPVVASSGGALPEVAADAALLPDPNDPDAIAEALRSALWDERRRRILTEAGRRRAAAFTWAATARGLVDAYREVVASTSS
jgi:glycosyltransferase involved in cell wall biosynthesis